MSVDHGTPHARVTLLVHRAESLVALNADGASNPFVEATIGPESRRTSVVSGTTNPAFESVFTFTACPLPTILSLKVYNRTLYGEAEELLGSATLTLFSASPMTRRRVQLGHGGNVSLSQKASDGCGSLDVSYEVVMMSLSEMAEKAQARPDENDLPIFLRDNSKVMNFISTYAGAPGPQELPPPPPPPPPPLPSPSMPPPPPLEVTDRLASSGSFNFLQQQQQPQQTSLRSVLDQTPQFFSVPLSAPPPPPPPPSSSPQQSESCAPSASDALLAKLMGPPISQNVNEHATPQGIHLTSSLPPSVLPPQTLSTTPPLTVGREVELSKAFNFTNSQYLSSHHPSAANVPLAPVESSSRVAHPSIQSASSLDEGMSVQRVVNTGDTMVERDAQRHLSSPSVQLTAHPTTGASPPSLSSTVTLSSTCTASSNAISARGPPQHPEQSQQLAKHVLQPATSNRSLPSNTTAFQPPPHSTLPPAAAAAAAPTAEKVSEKTAKKVTIVTTPKDRAGLKDRAGSATVSKPTVRAAPVVDRVSRRAVVSPMRENRRSSVSNGPRSSSRGRTPSMSAAAGNAHYSSSLYQWPDELLAAAVAGNTAVFQKLRGDDPMLSHGFEAVRDYSGRTILHLAAWNGHVDILKALLQASPSLPMIELRVLRSHNGNTILHSAAEGGRADVVQWLRFGHPATGALVGLRNGRGLTATDCAREAGFMEICTMLNES